MPDPGRVNAVREELKQVSTPSATGEERELREADGEPVGVPEPAIDENSPLAVAGRSGDRVWNMWDDETAAKLQQQAGERPLDPEQSEGYVVDERQPVRTTSLGVAPGSLGQEVSHGGLTGATGVTGTSTQGPTGPTGATGSTGTSAEERRERAAREVAAAEQAARAARQSGDGKDKESKESKQTAKSGV